jgi:peptidase E
MYEYMIRIILCGGKNSNKHKLKLLINEIIKYSPKKEKRRILIIPFARLENEWLDIFNIYYARYKRIAFKRNFILASSNFNLLKEQIRTANIIFIPGGNENFLKKYLRKIEFSLFDNKTVIGSSAGSNIFSSFYYSNDRNRIEKGLYSLPIKTVCHFDDKKRGKLKKLILVKKKFKIPTFAIEEGNFITLFF